MNQGKSFLLGVCTFIFAEIMFLAHDFHQFYRLKIDLISVCWFCKNS